MLDVGRRLRSAAGPCREWRYNREVLGGPGSQFDRRMARGWFNLYKSTNFAATKPRKGHSIDWPTTGINRLGIQEIRNLSRLLISAHAKCSA